MQVPSKLRMQDEAIEKSLNRTGGRKASRFFVLVLPGENVTATSAAVY